MESIEDSTGSERTGFVLLELIIAMVFAAVLALLIMPVFIPHSPPRGQRIRCVNNLKQLGLAYKVWALDNANNPAAQTNAPLDQLAKDGMLFRYYLNLTNELTSPSLLFCPAESDPARQRAPSFIQFTNDNRISYFLGLDGDETTPQMLLSGDHNLTINGVAAGHGIYLLRTNDFLAWTRGGHRSQGNVLLCDGSVQQTSSSRLQLLLIATGATNHLAFP